MPVAFGTSSCYIKTTEINSEVHRNKTFALKKKRGQKKWTGI